MTGQRAVAFWATAFLALGAADALERRIPMATPVDHMQIDGRSPIPTDPPGLPAGVPRELVERQGTSVPFPAPGYYCGLVGGDTADILTCVNARANCVFSGQAVGCCFSSRTRDCSDIPTTCMSWNAPCDSACSSNTRILRCLVTTQPYCGTYAFGGGRNLYVCRETEGMSLQVLHLTDYYSSVLGPSYTTMQPPTTTDDPLPTSRTSTQDEFTLSGRSSTTSSGGSPTDDPSPSRPGDDDDEGGGGLSSGAIAGIVIGVVAVVGALVAFLVWVFILKKRNADPPATTGGVVPPPLGSPPVNPVYGVYAPETKPVGSQPPDYATYAPPPVHHHQQVPEMPASNLQPHPPAPGHGSPHSPISVVSPSPHMSATYAGPVDPVYEMGPSR